MSLKPCGIINQPQTCMALQVNPFRVSQPGTFLSTSSDGKLYLTLLLPSAPNVAYYAVICVDLVHVSPALDMGKTRVWIKRYNRLDATRHSTRAPSSWYPAVICIELGLLLPALTHSQYVCFEVTARESRSIQIEI